MRDTLYTTILHEKRKHLDISFAEYSFLDSIHKLSNPVCMASRQYFADWMNMSRGGVIKMINRLEEKSLLIRENDKGLKVTDKWINTVYLVDGDVNKVDVGVNKVDSECQQSVQPSYSSNNSSINSSNNKKEEKNKKEDEELSLVRKKIIDYLNEKTNGKWKPNTAETKSLINARLNDGFTLNDFITCIDKKVEEWYGTEWGKYLRPSTLFSGKMERYVNEKTENDQFFEMMNQKYPDQQQDLNFDENR